MNKQEALKKIEKLDGLTIKDKDFNFDIEMIPKGEALEIVNQLDEPEKPVVPQFVADWYEGHKRSLEWTLRQLGLDMMNGVFDNTEMKGWLNNSNNKPIQTIVNMHQFDYEVEKEKLYTARFKLLDDDVEECYINQTIDDKKFSLNNLDENPYSKVKFTQEELKNLGLWENVLIDTNEVKDD